ncbi:MAG TPA: alpha/beta fold hydrolase [Actinomycetota bacterium]
MGIELPPLSTVDLDGPVAYRAWEGPSDTTFVLVHGLGGMHLNWVQVAPGLAGFGRVVALDLPGFGASPLAARGTHLMDQRRIVSRFIDDLATGDVYLVGNSMGGAIAVIHAAIEPGRVDGLVLTSAALPRVGHAWQHPSLALLMAIYEVPGLGDAAVAARVRHLDPERLVRMGFRFTTADPATIPEEIVRLHVDAVREHQLDPGAERAFRDAARSLLRLARRGDLTTRALDGVRCPVLVLHGRRDRLVPARYAEEVLRRYPTWRGRIFPDLGHVAQMEAPGRWVAEVADWYAGVAPRSR